MDNLEKTREKYFTGPLCNTFKEYKGCVLSQGFTKIEDQIYNMEVREDDIWVVSFPKSGTTWTQEMIWMIMNDFDFEEGRKTSLDVRSPFLELLAYVLSIWFWSADDVNILLTIQKSLKFVANEEIGAKHLNETCLTHVTFQQLFDKISSLHSLEGIEQEIPELIEKFGSRFKDSLAFVQCQFESKSSIIIKTHLTWELLPKEIQEGTKKPKIVYVSRNPKDVCVAYFYHSQQYFGYSGDFETFCELFLEGKLYYTPYWLNVSPFYKQNRSNIMFITYEEMIKDLPCVIRKVAEFLEKPLNEKQIENLAEHLSFDNMKKNPAVNRSSLALHMKPFHGTHQDFIRNGKTGDFKNTMSPEMISKFDKWIEKNTEGTEFVSRL